jgi:hypothetical protein
MHVPVWLIFVDNRPVGCSLCCVVLLCSAFADCISVRLFLLVWEVGGGVLAFVCAICVDELELCGCCVFFPSNIDRDVMRPLDLIQYTISFMIWRPC